jgi:2-dehydropantoate 2-reductase
MELSGDLIDRDGDVDHHDTNLLRGVVRVGCVSCEVRMNFVVLGSGAIGGVVGSSLHRASYRVTFIARGDHYEALRSGGLVVESPSGTTVIEVSVVNHPAKASFDGDTVVLLCVKSQHTASALEALAAHAPFGVPVACVQNGVANEASALRYFRNVLGVAVMCPAGFVAPGVVQAYSAPITGILDIGRYPAGGDAWCDQMAGAFQRCGFVSETRSDILRWKYRKLLGNLGNAVEAVCGPEARRGTVTESAVSEGEKVLEVAGIDYASAEEDRRRRGSHLIIGHISGQPRPGGSMWQSLVRQTGNVEVDYLNGEIVLVGRRFRLSTPANEALQGLARRASAERTPPGQLPRWTC